MPAKMLGLTHVTSSYALRNVLETGKIQAFEKCNILDEEVVYAFYGRAAFRSASDAEPSNLKCKFPSVLILDPNLLQKPKYVFAFDSGAFVNGMMNQYLHPYMPLFDFMLIPDIRSAAKLIAAVFETPESYLSNSGMKELNFPPSNYEAESYQQILMGGGRGPVAMDERYSTPEIIFHEPISVAAAVKAAVLPDKLADDAELGGKLKSAGKIVLDYPYEGSSRPAETYLMIRNAVRSAYGALTWL